jgi:putative oxidoreductase
MKLEKYSKYMPTALRVVLGALFIVAGSMKLFVMGHAGVTAFFASLGIPLASLAAWLVPICEVVFGAAVLLGYKINYTALPLAVIIAVAGILTGWKGVMTGNISGLAFHLLAAVVLVDLAARGPGAYALNK